MTLLLSILYSTVALLIIPFMVCIAFVVITYTSRILGATVGKLIKWTMNKTKDLHDPWGEMITLAVAFGVLFGIPLAVTVFLLMFL